MKLIFGIGNLPKGPQGSKVVAVGVFDGVHRGHQLVLKNVVAEARRRRIKSAVVTFIMHPSHVVTPDQKIPHLTSLEHRLVLLAQTGIDICYVFDFTRRFASLPAEFFVRSILMEKIGMDSLYIGQDFVFGRGGRGDKTLLKKLSQKYHFECHVLGPLKITGRVVSSTLIRRLIQEGNLAAAKKFLGRPVTLMGQIARGEGRGRTLGFPTANLRPHHEVFPPDGVYATQAFCQGRLFGSVTYVGTKPTFHPRRKKRGIEVYCFGLAKKLYKKTMEVRFIKRLHSDRKFASRQALAAHIKKDILSAQRILSR
ncbi:MAG: bifunctional riboflavin kinase/FAD synthetase [Candidatus Omnitrophota bacterium]